MFSSICFSANNIDLNSEYCHINVIHATANSHGGIAQCYRRTAHF